MSVEQRAPYRHASSFSVGAAFDASNEAAHRGEPGQALAWEGPIFIVGMPRSGTKLLRGLLCGHPCIRFPPAETEFLPFIDSWITRHGEPRSQAAFARLHEAMRYATYFSFRGATRKPFAWPAWREACRDRFDVAGVFEGFLRHELELPPGSGVIWADKSPSYVRYVPLLLQHFPAARIIHIVRDVRDHCVSIRKAWNKDIRRAAWQWGQDVLRAHGQCGAAPQNCIELKYEDLLQHPEEQLRRLCAFLDVEFLPRLAQLTRPTENLGDTVGRAEIVRDNFHKFAQRLTHREICAVESLAWEAMQELGYVPLYAHGPRQLGATMRRLLRLKDGLRLVVGDTPRRGVLGSVRFHASHQRMIGH